MFIVTKQHAYTQTILAVSPEIYYTEPNELALLSANLFLSLMMLCSYRPQRFWATNSTFPCDHQNQLDKPSLMYCVTWLCKLFSLSYDLFRRFYELEPKLVNVTNWNRKLFKWTEEFYILMRILSFKCLLDSWKAKIGVALGISVLFWKKRIWGSEKRLSFQRHFS